MEKTIRVCEEYGGIQQQETQSLYYFKRIGMFDIPNYQDEKQLCD